jgi:hypothetical protein
MMSIHEEEHLYARFANLPRPRYPFPNLVNAHIDELAEECNQWIDEDYQFHSQCARDRHKQHRLTDISARAFPTLTLAELRPVARFASSGAMMDDYFDHSSPTEVSNARDRIMALLDGQDAREPCDLGIYRQFYLLRQDALACGMPLHLYEKFIKEANNMFIAYQDEKEYIAVNQPPPLETFLVIRENSSGGVPFARYACMANDFRTLPDTVLEHPIVRRLHALSGRLIGWHNDIISLPKELHRKGDVVNLVRVLQREREVGLQDAYMMALKFHDQDLNEFLVLRENLPHFGACQELAHGYADALGVMIQGVYAWHVENCGRYVPGAYVEPERTSQEFQWQT